MCDISNVQEDLETLIHISKNHKVDFYCVCSSKNSIVYIAKTFDEATEFINEHPHIDLHIVSIKNGIKILS